MNVHMLVSADLICCLADQADGLSLLLSAEQQAGVWRREQACPVSLLLLCPDIGSTAILSLYLHLSLAVATTRSSLIRRRMDAGVQEVWQDWRTGTPAARQQAVVYHLLPQGQEHSGSFKIPGKGEHYPLAVSSCLEPFCCQKKPGLQEHC